MVPTSMKQTQQNISKLKKLQFDADFESGNLDLVREKEKNSFEIFIRNDSNSASNNQWFYFRVKVPGFMKNQTIKLGMKISIFSKQADKQISNGWIYGGNNIYYGRSDQEREINENNQLKYFEYKFEHAGDEVFFAYTVPYTYNQLQNHIRQLTSLLDGKIDNRSNFLVQQYLKVETLGHSTGSIQIPLLKIQSASDLSGKDNPTSFNLRQSYEFWIIPMTNPDGVIVGNYRSNLQGKDMNRCFFNEEELQYQSPANEVELIQKYLKEHITNYNQQVQDDKIKGPLREIKMFLDIHTHSSQRGIFIFAPQASIQDQHRVRSYPQKLDEQSIYFRLQSCKFSNDKNKKNCARLSFYRDWKIDMSYTIEASSYGYIDKQNNTVVQLKPSDLIEFGKHILIALASLNQLEEKPINGKSALNKGYIFSLDYGMTGLHQDERPYSTASTTLTPRLPNKQRTANNQSKNKIRIMLTDRRKLPKDAEIICHQSLEELPLNKSPSSKKDLHNSSIKNHITQNLSIMFDQLHQKLRKDRQSKQSSQPNINQSNSPKELYPVKKTVFQMFQDALNNKSFDNQDENTFGGTSQPKLNKITSDLIKNMKNQKRQMLGQLGQSQKMRYQTSETYNNNSSNKSKLLNDNGDYYQHNFDTEENEAYFLKYDDNSYGFLDDQLNTQLKKKKSSFGTNPKNSNREQLFHSHVSQSPNLSKYNLPQVLNLESEQAVVEGFKQYFKDNQNKEAQHQNLSTLESVKEYPNKIQDKELEARSQEFRQYLKEQLKRTKQKMNYNHQPLYMPLNVKANNGKMAQISEIKSITIQQERQPLKQTIPQILFSPKNRKESNDVTIRDFNEKLHINKRHAQFHELVQKISSNQSKLERNSDQANAQSQGINDQKRKRSFNEKDTEKLREIIVLTRSVDKTNGHPFTNKINFPDIMLGIDQTEYMQPLGRIRGEFNLPPLQEQKPVDDQKRRFIRDTFRDLLTDKTKTADQSPSTLRDSKNILASVFIRNLEDDKNKIRFDAINHWKIKQQFTSSNHSKQKSKQRQHFEQYKKYLRP
ncbi:zinc carboxypeptidase family protein [Stylonychia lemnae]|uniref:Zinc carboxypeptidase family protein n=1 Tax=Stylonychia lemnae TaxID=5949 RepID=A0A078ADF1_STYLE|nr:zinc carboxypeptidase family protein [Stylonychia lemnae]|eukprot:CDW80274.1 zinc carboxypeptidase family protein [Stylonychia lemnae]